MVHFFIRNFLFIAFKAPNFYHQLIQHTARFSVYSKFLTTNYVASHDFVRLMKAVNTRKYK